MLAPVQARLAVDEPVHFPMQQYTAVSCMSATSVSSIHLRDPIFQRSSIATPIHPVCQTIRRPTAGATPPHPHQHLRFLFHIFRFTSPPHSRFAFPGTLALEPETPFATFISFFCPQKKKSPRHSSRFLLPAHRARRPSFCSYCISPYLTSRLLVFTIPRSAASSY